jgi:hypothetical protein
MRRRWPWLAGAVALFGAAALLMSIAGAPRRAPPRVKMPAAMDADDLRRMTRRRTLPLPMPPAPANPEPGEPPPTPRLTDPVLRAMPAQVKRGAIVLEANAIRYSPIGQLLISCLAQSGELDFKKLKSDVGIDPLTDVDRISVFDDTFMVSGQFGQAKWNQVFKGAKAVALNDHTTLWQSPSADEKVVATWRDQLVIMGRDREAIEETVARLEGTAPVETPIIPESETYGEAYGAIAPDAIAKLLARDQPALAERLRQVVSSINLHLDASHDVGLVLDARGSGPDTVDFGKAVGSAMAVGRIAAAAQGNKDLGEILDYARVVPDGDKSGFRTELALPLQFFEEKLRDCRKGD